MLLTDTPDVPRDTIGAWFPLPGWPILRWMFRFVHEQTSKREAVHSMPLLFSELRILWLQNMKMPIFSSLYRRIRSKYLRTLPVCCIFSVPEEELWPENISSYMRDWTFPNWSIKRLSRSIDRRSVFVLSCHKFHGLCMVYSIRLRFVHTILNNIIINQKVI